MRSLASRILVLLALSYSSFAIADTWSCNTTSSVGGSCVAVIASNAYSTNSSLGMCPSPAIEGSGCPTSNLIGVCTYTYSFGSEIHYHYAGTYLTASDMGPFEIICKDSGGIWSSGGSGPTATTPLPVPPASQSAYLASNGQLPEAAVQVAADGTYGNAKLSVTLNVSAALSAARSRAGAGYNVYVIAMLPGSLVGAASPVLYVKPKLPAFWQPLQWPMAEFMSNVSQSAVNDQVLVEILDNTNILSLIGTEIYIGYGTSDQEMLAANRFRGVYKVQ